MIQQPRDNLQYIVTALEAVSTADVQTLKEQYAAIRRHCSSRRVISPTPDGGHVVLLGQVHEHKDTFKGLRGEDCIVR